MAAGLSVICDSMGEVVPAWAGRVLDIQNLFAAEIRTVEEAVDLAVEIGAIHIEVETDVHVPMSAFNKRLPPSRSSRCSADSGSRPVLSHISQIL